MYTAADENNEESVFYLDTLKDAKLLKEQLEKENKRREGRENLIRNRDSCFVRTCPIGSDRCWRRVWYFPEDAPRVWVEETLPEVVTGGEEVEEMDLVLDRAR